MEAGRRAVTFSLPGIDQGGGGESCIDETGLSIIFMESRPKKEGGRRELSACARSFLDRRGGGREGRRDSGVQPSTMKRCGGRGRRGGRITFLLSLFLGGKRGRGGEGKFFSHNLILHFSGKKGGRSASILSSCLSFPPLKKKEKERGHLVSSPLLPFLREKIRSHGIFTHVLTGKEKKKWDGIAVYREKEEGEESFFFSLSQGGGKGDR